MSCTLLCAADDLHGLVVHARGNRLLCLLFLLGMTFLMTCAADKFWLISFLGDTDTTLLFAAPVIFQSINLGRGTTVPPS